MSAFFTKARDFVNGLSRTQFDVGVIVGLVLVLVVVFA